MLRVRNTKLKQDVYDGKGSGTLRNSILGKRTYRMAYNVN